MTRDRGSVSIVLAAVLALVALLAGFTADVARVSVARGRLQAAADAAALAAAQEFVVPSARDPEEVASEYAARGGGRLISCDCDRDGDVIVEVERAVSLAFLPGSRSLTAAARAVIGVAPGSAGLQPWFAARLGCLFARVPGLTVVSGFRTRAEQERLHRDKPDLAAPPGRSPHERGLAADLSFPHPEARAAAHEAAEGCLLTFPLPHEPWHVEPAELAPGAAPAQAVFRMSERAAAGRGAPR